MLLTWVELRRQAWQAPSYRVTVNVFSAHIFEKSFCAGKYHRKTSDTLKSERVAALILVSDNVALTNRMHYPTPTETIF